MVDGLLKQSKLFFNSQIQGYIKFSWNVKVHRNIKEGFSKIIRLNKECVISS